MTSPAIEPLAPADFDAFAAYLDDHVADNGRGATPLFMPMARADSRFHAEHAASFGAGLERPLDGPGWRRAWVARDDAGRIVGHVDLRARPEPHAAHRCLLGVGVHRELRGTGLGARLLAQACDWAAARPALAWIDLQVLASNDAALRLYERAGFVKTGAVADMFRIDGEAFGYAAMTRALARP